MHLHSLTTFFPLTLLCEFPCNDAFYKMVQNPLQYITWPEVEGPGKGNLDHGLSVLWGGIIDCVDGESDIGGYTHIGVYILVYGCIFS